MENSKPEDTVSLSSLREAARLFPRYLEAVKRRARKTAAEIETKEWNAAARDLAGLADKVGRMISIYGLIYRDCRLFSQTSDKKQNDLREIKMGLLSILKAVQTAQTNRDRVVLADLLEYELQDNLTQWKIKAVPQIKEMIQTARP